VQNFGQRLPERDPRPPGVGLFGEVSTQVLAILRKDRRGETTIGQDFLSSRAKRLRIPEAVHGKLAVADSLPGWERN